MQGRTAAVALAENELEQLQNSFVADNAKANADIEQAVAKLKQAEADAAKAQNDVSIAESELARVQEAKQAWTVQLSRRITQRIVAPIEGVITEVFAIDASTTVKEGDVICRIRPIPTAAEEIADPVEPSDEERANEARANEDRSNEQPADQQPANEEPARRTLSSIPGPRVAPVARLASLSGMSGQPVTERIDVAVSLGRRLRECRARLQVAVEDEATPEALGIVADLKEGLAAAEFERQTLVAIIGSQLEAARKLHASQESLRQMVRQKVEVADLPPITLRQAEQAVVRSSAEVRQLELLLEFYQSLATEDGAAPIGERDIALRILGVHLETGEDVLGPRDGTKSDRSSSLRTRGPRD